MPASGVLNAADTPAAAPARISPGCRRGESRPTANMIDAPTCTVGPSRPMDAPHSRPSSSIAILPAARRSETSLARAASPAPPRRDHLRDAAAAGAREVALREEPRRREARRGEQPHDLRAVRAHRLEQCPRPVRRQRQPHRGRAHHDAAEHEHRTPLPAYHTDTQPARPAQHRRARGCVHDRASSPQHVHTQYPVCSRHGQHSMLCRAAWPVIVVRGPARHAVSLGRVTAPICL